MPEMDFQSIREQLQKSRETVLSGREALFLAREKLKRIEAQQEELRRRFDEENESHRALERELSERHESVAGKIAGIQERLGGVEEEFFGNLEAFLPLTDPRERIEELNDTYPILLLPLRLETRFKKVRIENRVVPQLWVRVFPDDCAVDTFEAALSETEVKNAQKYWAQVWRAGEDDNLRRAAWRNLVASHGAGRALWIEKNYRPVNDADQPTPGSKELLLVIPSDDPLDDLTQSHASTYWSDVWKANGSAAAIQAAYETLTAAVGKEMAERILKDYRPINLNDPPPVDQTHDTTTPRVVVVVFPSPEDTDTKRRAWSKAPHVDVMPERLVLMGYNGDKLTLQEISHVIPGTLITGPDPLAPEGDQIRQDGADLKVSQEMLWMVDFEEAFKKGMAFRVTLSQEQYSLGFDKLMVLGVRLSTDESSGQKLIEDLITNHHQSSAGFSLIRQGTPTNNTDDGASGYSASDNADESYEILQGRGEALDDAADWSERLDGVWLAQLLGLNSATLSTVPGATNSDVLDAQAMNIALFPATLGYTMDAMLPQVFSDGAIDFVRAFYTHLVSGRGLAPAIRIGKQPYGILPATVYSRMRFGRQVEGGILRTVSITSPYMSKLYEVLMRAHGVWGSQLNQVANVGDAGDPHQTLLEILGLHPNSVEFDQRYAESLQQVINTMNLSGLAGLLIALALLNQGKDLLRDHGYDVDALGRPDLLNKFFFGKPFPIDASRLIDDQPLSEEKPVRDYTSDGRNYIEWLIDTAGSSLESLRLQSGLPDTDRPTALLYHMLRHALMLGYYDTGLRLYRRADLLDQGAMLARRQEAPFIHVKQKAPASESRFKLLYGKEPVITEGQAGVRIADYITSRLPSLGDAAGLREQISALERLKDRSTAALERAFVEHLDTCSYRLDAWLLGLVHYQLSMMRYAGVEESARKGLYIGAYGWVENLKPDETRLSPVRLVDEELIGIFERENDPPLMRDSGNAGYVHAPSLNHAVTAAVLRNAYISTASPEEAEVFAVNLSSDRVRRAMAVIEGLRNGQSLSALLGYQLERGLHDRHSLAEVDEYIYVLRDRFPLVANRLKDTKTTENESISSIEARNVVDGEALVNHIENASPQTYPYGISGLPAPGTTAGDVIAAEMLRLVDTNDAVADLGLAEGIHQVVQGNYDRAAATLESLSSDKLPPIPDVVTTPRSGMGLTLRVGLHLKPGLSHTTSPVGGLGMTPRASAEPTINEWLSQILPSPSQVGTAVQVTAGDGTKTTTVVTQAQLGLQPIDLLYMLLPEDEQAMTALDDAILRHVSGSQAPDAVVKILYTQSIAPEVSFFELGALINQLRPLLLETRPLRSTDLSMPVETSKAKASLPDYRPERLNHLVNSLNDPTSGLNKLRNLETELSPLLDDTAANLNNLVSNIDTRLTRYIDGLAELNLYGLPQTGFGTAMEWRRGRYTALLDKVDSLVKRWQTKLDTFDTMLAVYGTLDPQTDDETRFALLAEIEKQVAIVLTELQPGDTPADYLALLPARKNALIAARTGFTNILGAPPQSLSGLLSSVETASAGMEAFDFVKLELDQDKAEIVRFTQDIFAHIQKLVADVDKRLLAVADDLTAYSAAATETARTGAFTHAAHTLLSTDFMVVPEFTLAGEQADELQNAYNARSTLLQYQTDTLGNDFPVDEWLYGVARVREMMHHWEALTMLTEAMQGLSLDLHPLQLPYTVDDRWLALPYPKEVLIDKDRLLYTAHYAAPFDKTAVQCGLLLDEWTEVIPTTEETTGVSFHYDRPNAEPPQVMLLAVPPFINGKWEWADLVDTLHETLELARRRAVEPDHLSGTDYARFLPATITAVTMSPITIAMNYAIVNNLFATDAGGENNG